MKPRHLALASGAAALALLGAIWLSSSQRPDTSSSATGPMAPGLAEALDSVTQVRLTGAGNTVFATFNRRDGGWHLEEKDGYRVDVEKLRPLLDGISRARRIEAKTALPERHAQLGVEAVSAADAHGVQVDIATPARSFSHVIGDTLARGTGTYVRASDEAQSWLVDRSITVERNPAHWLARQIIDVAPNRILRLQITPEDGPVIELVRNDSDPASDFAFPELPRGREAGDGHTREAIAGLLSLLSFEDVYPASEQPAPEAQRKAQYLLDDGRQVNLIAWQDEHRTLARFSMQLDEAAAQAWLARQPAADANEDEIAPAQPSLENLRHEVERFQQTHGNWVYLLPSFKANNLNRGLEDYLAPKS